MGGRQSLKHIDGDVPMCMRNKDKDVALKSKKIERSRGEGGGRHRYRHVEGDVMNVYAKESRGKWTSKENEKSSINRAKCDGGSKKTTKHAESESKGASSRSSTEANKTTSDKNK